MYFKGLLTVLVLLIKSSVSVYAQQQYATVKVSGRVFHLSLLQGTFNIKSKANNQSFGAKNHNYYNSFKIKDFDGDGYMDIMLEVGGTNTPAIFELLKYNANMLNFKKVRDFASFPAAERIGKSIYYYSYHHSGCADECWESDLFYLKNYKAIRIGNIDRQILDAEKGSLNIYKVLNSKRVLYKELPPYTEEKYHGGKWEFIKHYWFKNYKFFCNYPKIR
jgi:hypothetical protein